MRRIYVLCEGQTEDLFVATILYPHFLAMDCDIRSIVFKTKGTNRGGVATYGKIRRQILELCKGDRTALVTCLVDLYALPGDFPGLGNATLSARSVPSLLKAFGRDIGQPNFLPYLSVHEFEALLFSDPAAFAEWFGEDVVKLLEKIRAQVSSPEDINNSPTTAPSKRLLALCPHYQKVSHGGLIAQKIGLATMRSQCPFFAAWIHRLEQFASGQRLF